MPSVSGSILIERPAHEVFSALADPKVQMTYDGEMMQACEQLTPGAIGKGTRFLGTFRRTGQIEYEYEEFEADRIIQHYVKLPFGVGHHRFELSPDGPGRTRLTQTIDADLNLLGVALWPIAMKRVFAARVATLNGLVKGHVERTRPS